MDHQSVPITIVNHVSIDISCSPGRVWDAILEDYLCARKFSEAGYAIERLDDPVYFRGGFRMRLEHDGAVVDERICCVTELDKTARRLSMYAEYLTAPNEMKVHATYQAHRSWTGTKYSIDSYASFHPARLTEDGETDISAAVAKMEAHFEAALVRYLQGIQKSLQS
ncbi:hypothetical protein [Sphingopyxis flava]|jgi:hypothetical protein|uniref:Polyketide cyclase / dehydrase and lipid transport n=1 Tax=Sphingopyxis flava TaxID=1507287 RepID=A0A1T5DKL1_9SPHN|nr:hypothetical protein [Sphingopyxis flava]SKB72167.1 hypothetical protein SAMN06295937_101512 [Sphingopyxis flava]